MMRIPSACSLRRLPARSAMEHQGREQALNLRVTLKLLTSSTSPSKVRTLFYLKGPVRLVRVIRASLKQSHSRVKGRHVDLHICAVHLQCKTST